MIVLSFIFALLFPISDQHPPGDHPPNNDQQKFLETQQSSVARQLTVHDWNYDEHSERGPRHWLRILCSANGGEHLGDCQSPIALTLPDKPTPITEPLFLVNYQMPLAGQLINTGCGVQFRPIDKPTAEGEQLLLPEIQGGMLDQNYRFVQYHFHWAQKDDEGSEHTVNGRRYSGELHLVHQGVDDPSKLAVLAIFLVLDNNHNNNNNTEAKNGARTKQFVFSAEEMKALKKVVKFKQYSAIGSKHSLYKKLPSKCCQRQKVAVDGAKHLLPVSSSFFRYAGSLTTPPCSENVTWTVFTEPLLITRKEMSLLRSLKDCRNKVIKKNCRPVQKCANDRQVHYFKAASLDGDVIKE